MNGKLNLPINTVIGVSLLVLLLVPALYFAKPVLLPMVISTFVALLFSPLINYFEDKGLPRTITVVVTLTLLVSVSILGLAAISEPAKQWWAELPSIVQNVSQEVNEVTKASSEHMNAPLEIASDMNIDEMGNNTVFSLLKALATTTPTLLTQAMIVLFMVYFMLNHGRSLFRKSVSRLHGFSKQRQAVELVQALQKDLSRYIGTITLVNAGLGLCVGLVFFVLGLEDPFLWGAFAGVMNFAPYLGPVISMVSFGFVAYLQLDSVSFMLTVVSIYLLLNLIESQFVTPTLLGRRFNLNPLVIFMWLVFWGWLWGGMGLLIGVPLLVCINILADRLALCGSTNI
ncbi:AI-2E family transporter [Vibrio parahaemolyticus]|uniref:AI-2E family transporter n=1 Tax=Vibrio parahaemolyticus TaxID=670 RepID=UPI00084AB1D4|nr:AI-2E family transporter [Vibrio parahaemolyticus]EGQ8919126.1 AI-2E family transporter [Vibrio parahaemolyticus]EHU5173980.1 AI-2E family transporter [Vibrio parahaemolyticus]EHV5545424.1 AI-2E family transporter [Vibrio parahaemolyticus]MCC3791893.1 AI-2E family transporter [Vibrio parahaemolyticus]MCG9644058.1 AI-2E family transporter [Vibrio parahaemolyticus]